MDDSEPRTQPVDELMQGIRVCDAVDGCVDGQGEEEDIGQHAETVA